MQRFRTLHHCPDSLGIQVCLGWCGPWPLARSLHAGIADVADVADGGGEYRRRFLTTKRNPPQQPCHRLKKFRRGHPFSTSRSADEGATAPNTPPCIFTISNAAR